MKHLFTQLIFIFAAIAYTGCQSVAFVDDSTNLDTSQLMDTGTETDFDTSTTTGIDSNTDSDTTLDTSANSCAPPGTTPLVCEDFESGLPSVSYLRNGEVSLVADPVFMGEMSLKSETTMIESFAFIANKFEPIETGTVYFRMHIFIPAGEITGLTKVMNLSAGGNPDVDELLGIDVNVFKDKSVQIYQHGNSVRFNSAPDIVPEGEWFCLRGSYTISSTAGETTVWINDGLAASTTANTESIINGGVSEFRTGIGWTEQGQDNAVFYFDNILVNTVPVDCSL